MSFLTSILVSVVLAQPMQATPPASNSLPPEQQPVFAEVTAVRASFEEGAPLSFDDELSPLQSVFDEMPAYNVFKLVKQDQQELMAQREVALELNALYTLYVTQLELIPPPSPNAPVRVVFDARAGLQQGGSELNALSGRGEAPVGQTLLFQDLPMGDDKLVVMLRFKQDDEGSEGDNPQQQQQQEDQQEGQSDQQEPNEQQQQEQEQEQSQQDSEQDEEQEQSPQDRQEEEQEAEERESSSAEQQEQEQEENQKEPQHGEATNIEALLQSLEEVDKREQELEHQSTMPARIKGDWW